jgi:hypothetical protein
VREL